MPALRFQSLACVVISALVVSACSDTVTSPASAGMHGEAVPSRTVANVIGNGVGAFVSRFFDTPLGEQPAVTPSLRIVSPTSNGRIVRDRLITIRVAYANFDNRPELRTPNAGATLGTMPQVVTEGFVQGHVHGYLQRIPDDGSMPDVNATSFCVLERIVSRNGYDGVVEGECPAVPAGDYRLSAEFQTNSHTALLKTGPRATPTADVLLVRVR